jgi:hypothetical protein
MALRKFEPPTLDNPLNSFTAFLPPCFFTICLMALFTVFFVFRIRYFLSDDIGGNGFIAV